MRELRIRSAGGNCRVIVGGSAVDLRDYCSHRNLVVIADKKVRSMHAPVFAGLRVIEIEAGEGVKTLKTVEMIYRKLLAFEVDRSTFIVGIGGGVVCDLAGFSASTFLRGLPFGFVPTTLLAMADASIGGKNGLNLDGYKNLVGVIRQPDFVVIDPSFLKTLPEEELRSGASEIVKHALIKSPLFFRDLERNWRSLLSLERGIVERTITRSILIKSEIVQADGFERGERRKLNFGHTFGHAIERETRLGHGQSVAIGMAMACRMSLARGMLSEEETARVGSLLSSLGLPTRRPGLDGKMILEAIRKDKKRQDEVLFFVLLAGLGRAEVQKISWKDLEEEVNDLCEPR